MEPAGNAGPLKRDVSHQLTGAHSHHSRVAMLGIRPGRDQDELGGLAPEAGLSHGQVGGDDRTGGKRSDGQKDQVSD